jgi:hypothetical protein
MSSEELPNAKVLQTTITPNERGLLVRLSVSDGSLVPASDEPPDQPHGAIRVDILVQIERDGAPLLPRIEWQALRLAGAVLADLERQKGAEARNAR